MPKIKKLLIANRGEIACRIIRTAREMGIATVAVFSEADRKSPHVRMADEAYLIGLAVAAESYLVPEKIIAVAKTSGADAIHPGYGFLSERSSFAKMVSEAGIVFLGPSPESIDLMGDKISSKKAVEAFDVPLVPGSAGAMEDMEEVVKLADSIGYPVMVKASAGGGGKGMRIVHNPEEIKDQFAMAVSEAQRSFGDGRVFVEKFIENPRHIEVQILGDQQGNILYLFERECSIQRRHQKVIEEAPGCTITPELRKRLGEAAVNVAKACNYYSAGTVEFIMAQDGSFYFLEMNTRLQVEHPVTEFITGLDLVEWQIRIGQGESLPFAQEDLRIRGHSIEARVYAEDPTTNFMPDTGLLTTYQPPKGPGIRVDDGLEEGMEVSIYYDPMIAKLIVHGEDRAQAIKRMIRAIDEYDIVGCKTTLPFCKFVMEHEKFISGDFSTNFVKEEFSKGLKDDVTQEEMLAAAVIAFVENSERQDTNTSALNEDLAEASAWKANRKWL